jgi:hypothetical protein
MIGVYSVEEIHMPKFDLKEATDYQFTVEGIEFGATFDHRPFDGPLVEVFGVDGEKVGSAKYDHNASQIHVIVDGEDVPVNYWEFEGSMKPMAEYIGTICQY